MAHLPSHTSVETYTMKDFVYEKLPQIDCHPVGQRLPINQDDSVGGIFGKSQKIIESLLQRIHFGMLTLNVVSDENGNKRYTYESIDGGHRKRAVRDYVAGKFPAYDPVLKEVVYYSQLSVETRKLWDETVIVVTFYTNLTNAQQGEIFRIINTTTPVNHQEKLNSYGNIPIANVIRETVRHIDDIVSNPHDLFEQTRTGAYKFIAPDNNRLRLEELVARIYYRYYSGGNVGPCDNIRLEEMYAHVDAKEVPGLKKKVDRHLDFLLKMATMSKHLNTSLMGWKELLALVRVFFWLDATLGKKWDIDKPQRFYEKFKEIFSEYSKDIYDEHDEIFNAEFESANSSVKDIFNAYCTCYDSQEKQDQLMKWIMDPSRFDIEEYIMVKDTKRTLGTVKNEAILAAQQFKDPEGNELTMKTAQGSHDRAYAKGGKTTVNTITMIRTQDNQDRGTLTDAQWEAAKAAE